MMFNAMPRLPRSLLHILTVSERVFKRDTEKAGQSRPVYVNVNSFWGVVLPLSHADWKQLPEGVYTKTSQKLYTDDTILIKPGQIIRDTFNGQQYTVITEMNYNSLYPMRRYILEGLTKQ